MGCRLVACITVFVIICLELLTNIIAFPSNKFNNNAEIPIHKRQLKTGEQYTFKSQDFTDIKTIHAFSADPGEILSIKFESIEIDNPRYDVINVYSGTPQSSSVSEKSKTTDVQSVLTQAQFKDQIKRMPLLISSKSASDTIHHVLIETDKLYQADSNELTVLFDKSHNGQFMAMIESRPANKNYDTRNADANSEFSRSARDPTQNAGDTVSSSPDVGKSFDLCRSVETHGTGKQGNERIFKRNHGTVISHPEYKSLSSESKPNLELEKYADTVCTAEIHAEGKIKIEVGDIQLSDYDLNCSGQHLLIEDLTNTNKIKQVKLCDSDDALDFQFSNKIRLTLTLGTFLADASGFSLRYNAVIEKPEVEQEEPEKQREEKREETRDETTVVTSTGKKLKNLIQPVNVQNAEVNEATEFVQQPKVPPKLLPGFLIISMIVVAILLIVILSAAGAIACYRNHQQEQIITSMHERLSDIQGTSYSPVDGSHTSLRNKLKMMPADGGSIVCQKVTEEDHRLLSSPESNK